MTIDEAKKMVGTEFVYVFEDGDEIPAYVKMFDTEIGLTCLTLDPETQYSWKPCRYQASFEEDGTWCLIGIHFDIRPIEEALCMLEKINETGKFKVEDFSNHQLSFDIVSCAFR